MSDWSFCLEVEQSLILWSPQGSQLYGLSGWDGVSMVPVLVDPFYEQFCTLKDSLGSSKNHSFDLR